MNRGFAALILPELALSFVSQTGMKVLQNEFQGKRIKMAFFFLLGYTKRNRRKKVIICLQLKIEYPID